MNGMKGNGACPPQDAVPADATSPLPRNRDARAPQIRGGHVFLACLFLALVTILPYAQTWRFEFVFLDDVFFLRDGRWFFEDWSNMPKVFIQDVWEFVGERSSLYRPLLLLPRFLEVAVFGTSPGPYHIPNTLLHWAAVSVLFMLLRRLVDDLRIALAVTVLFALHPAHVPAIAWIEGYNNTMTAFFVLAAVLLALVTTQSGRVLCGLLSGTAFLAALFTKESAVSTPLLAFGIVWLARRGRAGVLPRRALTITAVTWVCALAIWFVLRSHAVAETPEFDAPYVLESIRRGWPGLLLYWGKVFLPFNLTPLPILANSTLLFGVVAVVIYAVAIIWSRGDRRQALLLGAGWFIVLISPSLLVSRLETPSGAIFREDRLYQASIGVFIAMAFLLRGAARPQRTMALAALGVCAAIGLGLGQARMADYASGRSYWTAAVRGSPDLALAHQLLAVMYRNAGDTRAEKAELLRALDLNPQLEDLHNDLAIIFLREGSLARADRYLEAELARFPNSVKAHFNRALLQLHEEDFDGAHRSLETCLQLTEEHSHPEFRRSVRALLARVEREKSAAQLLPARTEGAST